MFTTDISVTVFYAQLKKHHRLPWQNLKITVPPQKEVEQKLFRHVRNAFTKGNAVTGHS